MRRAPRTRRLNTFEMANVGAIERGEEERERERERERDRERRPSERSPLDSASNLGHFDICQAQFLPLYFFLSTAPLLSLSALFLFIYSVQVSISVASCRCCCSVFCRPCCPLLLHLSGAGSRGKGRSLNFSTSGSRPTAPIAFPIGSFGHLSYTSPRTLERV